MIWGYMFGLEARNRAFKYFSSVHFTENQGLHELALDSLVTWKISLQVPAKLTQSYAQNLDARKAISATLLALK